MNDLRYGLNRVWLHCGKRNNKETLWKSLLFICLVMRENNHSHHFAL